MDCHTSSTLAIHSSWHFFSGYWQVGFHPVGWKGDIHWCFFFSGRYHWLCGFIAVCEKDLLHLLCKISIDWFAWNCTYLQDASLHEKVLIMSHAVVAAVGVLLLYNNLPIRSDILPRTFFIQIGIQNHFLCFPILITSYLCHIVTLLSQNFV